MNRTNKTQAELLQCIEPTANEIAELMADTNENFYAAREQLREAAYGGKPPAGYSSWGDYWKGL